MAPDFNKLAEEMKSSSGVVAKVNCDEHKDLCSRFGVRGYPTVVYLENGEKKENYSGARTTAAMKSWFGKKTGDVTDAPAAYV